MNKQKIPQSERFAGTDKSRVLRIKLSPMRPFFGARSRITFLQTFQNCAPDLAIRSRLTSYWPLRSFQRTVLSDRRRWVRMSFSRFIQNIQAPRPAISRRVSSSSRSFVIGVAWSASSFSKPSLPLHRPFTFGPRPCSSTTRHRRTLTPIHRDHFGLRYARSRLQLRVTLSGADHPPQRADAVLALRRLKKPSFFCPTVVAQLTKTTAQNIFLE